MTHAIDQAVKGLGLEPTPYAYEAYYYAHKAKLLQDHGNLGGTPYPEVPGVNDPLMQSVTIYDCVQRRYAGFSNILEDLWKGEKSRKFYKWPEEHQAIVRRLGGEAAHSRWGLREWLFLFLVHRMTGSGASFESDHGYRNSILFDLAEFDTVEQMHEALSRWSGGPEKRTIFTSIGNQIPAMPKPTGYNVTNAQEFFSRYSLRLVNALADALPAKRRSMQKVFSMMLRWNEKQEIRRFKFPYAAMVADMADYFPEYVDPRSDFMHGKNAQEALGLMFKTTRRRSTQNFLDDTLRAMSNAIDGNPYDVEDVMCDSIRFVENYIPLSKLGTYDHLDLDEVFGDHRYVEFHTKGRQQWFLTHGLVPTFRGHRQFGDHAVLEANGKTLEDALTAIVKGPRA